MSLARLKRARLSDVTEPVAKADQIARWITPMRAGDSLALGRLITLVENGQAVVGEVLAAIHPWLGHATVVGFTGAPGVGKSSLVNSYVYELRSRGRTVGVVAVDPSSPIGGGAILGDRIRMSSHAADAGVFIRSLASRGHLGGLSRASAIVVDLMDAAGKDVVIVETVGTGQSDVDIAQLADVSVLICTAGYGDVIQFEKAGILEIADLFVVNKSDLAGADRVVTELNRMVHLDAAQTRPRHVIRTCATTGQGVVELTDHIDKTAAELKTTRCGRTRRTRLLIAVAASEWLRDRIATLNDVRLEAICERVARGETTYEAALREVLALV
jgi:LAO/AO transport system kinase